MKYGLDDRPGALPLLLYGAQWWVVTLPCVLIMGLIVARLHIGDAAGQIFYMQKLFALTGVMTVVQALFGHRLPLVVGPASTLLVGIMAAAAVTGPAADFATSSVAGPAADPAGPAAPCAGLNSIYSAIAIGGAVLALVSASGLLARLRVFFTSRIVAVILVLIAFTLTPTILKLIFADPSFAGLSANPAEKAGAAHLLFALGLVFVLVLCNAALPGFWKSLTVILGLAGGSVVYSLLFDAVGAAPLASPGSDAGAELSGHFPIFITAFEPHAGMVVSFLFCFLALAINELGSIESIGRMLGAGDMQGRIRRGSALQGAGNVAAGSLGLIGTVDFSMSAGLIAATGCASRFTLVPAGLGIIICAFVPGAVEFLSRIPAPVMGALMLYLMASQLAGGLGMLVAERGVSDFGSGLIVGLPLMIGLVISFAPQGAFDALPDVLHPIAANGFVMGALAVILLEHV
ncbi:purine/pyrimidine permease, partial [Desulfovibrio sp. OttesenSCG-928-A18]|nr:purine/pyrimidine permease [Desulfovibrio sp. OttesenSCG-928-A18]